MIGERRNAFFCWKEAPLRSVGCTNPQFSDRSKSYPVQFYPHLVEYGDGLPVVGLQHVEVGPAQGRDVGVQVEGVTAAGADHLLRPIVPPRLDEGDLEAVSDGPHMLAGVLGPRPEDGNNSLLWETRKSYQLPVIDTRIIILTEKMTSFPLRYESVVRRNIHRLCV